MNPKTKSTIFSQQSIKRIIDGTPIEDDVTISKVIDGRGEVFYRNNLTGQVYKNPIIVEGFPNSRIPYQNYYDDENDDGQNQDEGVNVSSTYDIMDLLKTYNMRDRDQDPRSFAQVALDIMKASESGRTRGLGVGRDHNDYEKGNEKEEEEDEEGEEVYDNFN